MGTIITITTVNKDDLDDHDNDDELNNDQEHYH